MAGDEEEGAAERNGAGVSRKRPRRSHGLSIGRVREIALENEEVGKLSKVTLECLAAASSTFAAQLAKEAAGVAAAGAAGSATSRKNRPAEGGSSSSANAVLSEADVLRVIHENAMYDFLRNLEKDAGVARAKPKRGKSKKSPGAGKLALDNGGAADMTLSGTAAAMGVVINQGFLGHDEEGPTSDPHPALTSVFEEDDDYE